MRSQQIENIETEEVELTDETKIRGIPWSTIKKDMKKKDFLLEWPAYND